ncbi:hypothetical protein M413DRAFT_445021 [Hebeloma cylindrosporum]|uniref:Uncharacterized protein n=1 Tax=Hebeloma cylindrosporum TaxID=76867 RepID=A0A0C3CC34_HEBCY|nr:hypothetical protein M413DRAFT_445021 [Hebeloma cylindrosporum h7]
MRADASANAAPIMSRMRAPKEKKWSAEAAGAGILFNKAGVVGACGKPDADDEDDLDDSEKN